MRFLRVIAFVWAAAIVELGSGSSVFAELPLRGKIFSNVYVPVSKPLQTPVRQALTSAWLQWDPSAGESAGARILLTADAFEASSVDSSIRSGSMFRLGVREGYGEYDQNGLQIRAGKQIVPWGKADAINPTDFLTAKDFSLLNPDEEVRRIGATLAWVSWTPLKGTSPLTFSWVWIPVFAQHRLLIPVNAIPGGVDLSAMTPNSPEKSLKNSETAFKVSYAGSGWDASLSAFRGWNHFPEFTVSRDQQLQRTFQQIRALGGDASFSWSDWVLRAEAAYVWTEYDRVRRPEVQPTRVDGVIGVERSIANDFRFQFQGVMRYHPEFLAAEQVALPSRELARGNQLLTGSQFRSRPGGTVRFSYLSPSSGFEAEFFALWHLTGGDYLFKPKVSYPWNDAFRTSLSADYYGGPSHLSLGALQAFNSVCVEAKYSF